jgi:GT2 family glycosyltransferase
MDDTAVDDLAPAVVAVVVTRDPGPWFEETLAGLAAQDYAELSVLVMVSGGEEDPTARVAAVLPSAYVRRLEDDRGFGAAVDEAVGMVEGASYFLLCHDDCAPDPDALHVLVEESFRSNAGIVCPKMVTWDDPDVLLHVGLSADKCGAVVERVQEGEIDAGQHDAVRDVFVAPGGFTLVRADLLAELGGFDPEVVAMGEDLDLSWRAQVAGARVVVAPDARVRHLEAVAGGLRAVATGAGETEPPSLQALQRRHELRAVLKCYGPFHLARVLPQAALLAAGEVVVALAVGDRTRARAVGGAWRWNLSRLKELRRRRAEVKAHRVFDDREVRRLQLRGSARLNTYVSRLAHQGFDVAHGRIPATAAVVAASEELGGAEPLLTGSVGSAFSEDTDFDELDDLGHRSGRDRSGRRRRRAVLTSHRSRLLAAVVVAGVLVVGSRDLFGGGLPLLGQYVPMLSWTGTWHQLVTGWQSAGVGTTAPSTPAFGVLGILGTFLVGAMGLLQKVVVLGCIPLGAWGVSRLLRPLASPRARLVAAVSYLGLALAYDELAQGRLDGLVAYAAVPWILSRLARASGLPPYTAPEEAVGWRSTLPGQMLTLGVIEAVAAVFAPAVAVAVLVCALGVMAGSLLVGEWRGSGRVLGVAAGATGVAAVLCAPWVVGTLLAGRSAVSVFGLPGSAATSPSWSDLLRFAVGPAGTSALSWLLVAAALLPLLIGRQSRLAWAGRFSAVAVLSWLLALAVAQGWTHSFAPTIDVLLAPAATAVAAGVGLGVASFEVDLAGYHFGWRQVATGLALLAAVVGLLPVLADAGDGRWGLADTGFTQALASLPGEGQAAGGSRVLWLGDPRALPVGAWSVSAGLGYATSEVTTPDATTLWAPASPGPAAGLADAVRQAQQGLTANLGRLLAPDAVRYVVVIEALAPQIPGVQTSPALPPPPGLVASLRQQTDLSQVSTSVGGLVVFENTTGLPQRAERTRPLPSAGGRPQGWPTAQDVTGWRPVLPGPPGRRAYSGAVTSGTVFASYAPAGRWRLRVHGLSVDSSPAFGWAGQYQHVPAGTATLRLGLTPLVPLAVTGELVLWLLVAGTLLGSRRWLDWWRGWIVARRAKKAGDGEGADDGGSVDAAPAGDGPAAEPPMSGAAP